MNQDRRAHKQSNEVNALIRELSDVESRLRELMGGHVDGAVHPDTGAPVILQQTRRELRQNRARLQLILEQLPAVTWTTDDELRVTSASGAPLSDLSIEIESISGRRIGELDPFLRAGEVLPAHRQALEGDTTRFEARVQARTFDCSVEPLRNASGEIVGCVGLAVDVTARVETEEALQATRDELERRVEDRTAELSQAYEELRVTEKEIRQQNQELLSARQNLETERRRYRELFEFAPDGYVVTDGSGIIEAANRAASELLETPTDSVIGNPLSQFVDPEDQEALQMLMGRAKQEDPPERIEAQLRLVAQETGPFPASVSVAAVQHPGDRVGMRWMLRDIGETQQLIDENRRQRTFLERLMDVAPVGIAVVRGRDHRFEMANAYYRAIPGPETPVLGRTFVEVFGQTGEGLDTDLLDQVYQTAEPVRLRQRRGVPTATGEPTYWSVDLVPLAGPDGTVDGVLIVAQDVSQEVRARKGMERLAVRTQRQADQLTTVFEAMSDAVIVYDNEGTPIRANPAAAEAYGLDPVGTDRQELIENLSLRGPQRQPITVNRLPSSRALRGERVDGARYIFTNAKGEEVMIIASAAPLPASDDGGGAVVVWHDVTERERLLAAVNSQRRKAENLALELRKERDKLQTIMENTHAQLAYLDADFNFVHVNTAYAQGAGYSREELIDQNHFDIFPSDENRSIFEQVRETGEPISFRGKPFSYVDQPDRGITYWDWSLVPVHNEEGEVDGLVFSLLNVTERERLMRQLDAEQARLNAIIENTPEGIVVVDHRARITLTNPAADEIYGREVPYGEPYHSHTGLCICHPDGTALRPRDLPLTRAALDGERHEDEELALVTPKGKQRDLLVSADPIRSGEGEITGAVGVFRDITERKAIEATLRRHTERLRVLHELDQAILVAHSAGEIAETALTHLRHLVPCQRASVELFDFEADEATLLAVDTEVETNLRQGRRMPLAWNRALDDLRQGRPHVVDDLHRVPPSPSVERLRQEGLQSFVSVPLQAGDDLMGALNVGMGAQGSPPPEYMTTVQEIAQQLAIGIRQARLYDALQTYAAELEQRVSERTAQLRASEARFRAIFEQSALGIALLDSEAKIIAGNGALQELLGQTGEALQGRTFADFAHDDVEVTAHVPIYREMRAGQRDHYRVETRYVGADEKMGWANLVLSLVRDSQGEPQFIIAIVEDITERKRAQQALIQSEKLATTGRLAASLAHEINNPLQTVIGCLGLAEESMQETDGDVDTYVTMAHDELKRAARIVSRLRDLSRPSDPKSGEPTEVNDLVESVLDVTRKDLKDHGIRIERDLEEGLPKPVVMPDRIKQVLLNLVLNARDAMPGGGKLSFTSACCEDEGTVAIKIADQGPGIPDDVMDHLFDPFFSTKDEGTGLGLFVSRNIVQEHGGRIEVESTIGEGTAFTVTLPVSRQSNDEQ